MTHWRRWIRPGLVATFVLALVAVIVHSGDVARDVAGRAAERIAADGQDWARVEASGRAVTIYGTAPSTEAQQVAVAAAGSARGVLSVTDRSDLLPVASPYVWSARKAGPVVTLIGAVPSEGFRNSLLAAARRAMPEARIHDQMQLARGAPDTFNNGTAFVLARLAMLADATATISDSTLSISGVAADSAAFAAARSAFQTDVPPQLALGPIDILPARADPFTWAADYDGTTVTLSGHVPNEIVGNALLAAAHEVLPDATTSDETRVASGAPDGFAEAASFAIAALARLNRGSVALSATTLTVSGAAKSVDDYEAVTTSLAAALPKGFALASSDIAPATVAAYGWRGERTGKTVTLTGYVPTPAAREAVRAVARELFADDSLVDQVRVAAGEPRMDWLGGIKFALGQLSRLERGVVLLGDRTFSVEGEAATPEAYTDLLTANAQTLPASLKLESADVRPPVVSPFRFVVARTPDALTLDGYVGSEADRKRIVDAAGGRFGGMKVVDRLAYASGAPEKFVRAATVAVHAVARLAGGYSEISDASLNISGGAYYPAAAGAIVDAVGESVPEGYDVALSIMVRQPAQPVTPIRCRALLEKTMSFGRIEFAGGEAEVASDSHGLLDRVAATIARCPEATIEVAAHTDSDGSTEQNQKLSQARAEAIVEFLVDAGIRRERLTATGHGEEDPIADNATEAGKAANRRIEFTLKTPGETPDGTAEEGTEQAEGVPEVATGTAASAPTAAGSTPPVEDAADAAGEEE